MAQRDGPSTGEPGPSKTSTGVLFVQSAASSRATGSGYPAVRNIAVTRSVGNRREEVAQVHLQDDCFADVRRDERPNRPPRAEAVRGVVRWDEVEDLAEQPPLDRLQRRLGRLDEPRRSGPLHPPVILVMPQRAVRRPRPGATTDRRTTRVALASAQAAPPMHPA